MPASWRTRYAPAFICNDNEEIFIKITLLIFILISNIVFSVHVQNDSLETNEPQFAPSFEFITLDEDTVSSIELKCKVIILDFWSSTCGPCIKAMPNLEKLYKKYKNKKEVAIYLVNNGWESIEKARKFANKKRSGFLFFSSGEKYDLPFAYDKNSNTFKSFNLHANPSTVIIDQNYRIHLQHTGQIKNIDSFLGKQIEQLLSQS